MGTIKIISSVLHWHLGEKKNGFGFVLLEEEKGTECQAFGLTL